MTPPPDRSPDGQAYPSFVLDLAGVVVGSSETGDRNLTGLHFDETVLDESEHGGFAEVLRLAFIGVPWSGELSVRGAPSGVRVSPLITGDGVTGALVVLSAAGRRGTDGGGLPARLTRLAGITAELVEAEDLPTLTDILISHLADAAGATTASLSVLVDDSTLALVGLRGGTPGAASRWATYSVEADTPAGEAVRSGATLVMVGRQAIRERFPGLDMAAEGERSMVCLPLAVSGRPLGVVSLSFPYRHDVEGPELDFLRLLADLGAQALERIRAVEEASDQATKLQFLAEASAELGSSLDYQSTLRNVAWLAVPRFADWCAIALEQDGVLHTIAVAHSDPEKLAIAEDYQRRYPPDRSATTGGYQVLRTGESQLTTEVTDDLLVAAAQDDEQLAMLRALSFRSGLVVPLKARGRTFGTLTWVSGEDGRRFGFSDVSFGEDLARRAATAIDNALLHRELRDVADRLQAAVRPPDLPRTLPGWELGALYSPAGRTDVGGDFYDVIPLDDHRLAVFIGDVMGRGVEAAAAMAQIRAGVRTLIAIDPTPASVMARLDLLFEQFPTDQLVTFVYGVLDGRHDQLAVSAAGHPPPVVLAPDGSASFVDSARGLILGAGGATRGTSVVPFRPGSTLLLYTDGLLERRREDFEVSKQRLLGAAGSLAGVPDLCAALPALADALRDPTHEDDLAVVAVRRACG